MLGPNPKKAGTPSTATSNSSSSSNDSNISHGDGLMVKAIDDIFKFVESSENPQEFRVSNLSQDTRHYHHISIIHPRKFLLCFYVSVG